MADRQIIFSGSMVRALLDGRKTQHRVLLKPQPYAFPHPTDGHRCWNASGVVGGRIVISDAELARLHRYAVGDRLYVREALQAASNDQGTRWLSYAADGKDVWPLTEWYKPRNSIPSIHMPRWASRITLVVTGVRVQRLQDISEEDARAEGVQQVAGFFQADKPDGMTAGATTARAAFGLLWNSLHGPDDWDANPWVVAVTFTVHKTNIDQMEAAHAA